MLDCEGLIGRSNSTIECELCIYLATSSTYLCLWITSRYNTPLLTPHLLSSSSPPTPSSPPSPSPCPRNTCRPRFTPPGQPHPTLPPQNRTFPWPFPAPPHNSHGSRLPARPRWHRHPTCVSSPGRSSGHRSLSPFAFALPPIFSPDP